MDELDTAGFFPKDPRPKEAAFDGGDDSSHHDALGFTRRNKDDTEDFDERKVGMGVEIGMLVHREWVHHNRDKASLVSKYGLAVFLGILIGIIFFDVGNTPNNVQAVSALHAKEKVCL